MVGKGRRFIENDRLVQTQISKVQTINLISAVINKKNPKPIQKDIRITAHATDFINVIQLLEKEIHGRTGAERRLADQKIVLEQPSAKIVIEIPSQDIRRIGQQNGQKALAAIRDIETIRIGDQERQAHPINVVVAETPQGAPVIFIEIEHEDNVEEDTDLRG